MYLNTNDKAPQGFTLIELLVVIAVIALLMSILLPALREARRTARTAACHANLQQIGRSHHAYATDFKGGIGSFNGLAELPPTAPPQIGYLTDILLQARAVVVERGNREKNSALPLPEFQVYTHETLPFEQYSHLPLVDYMGGKLPIPATVCPEDLPRLDWSHTPLKMELSPYQPKKNSNKANLLWWPYSASYQLMPTAVCYDGPSTLPRQGADPTHGPRYSQSETHDTYLTNKKSGLFGRRRLDEVAFPALKVGVADSQQRHFDRWNLYYAYAESRQPLLMWDSSVSVRRTRESNPGWDPRYDASIVVPHTFLYTPDTAFESITRAQRQKNRTIATELVTGHYKWTRGGLRGIDFGGSEISTSGWR